MSHFYLACPSIRKIKEKKKKRILNIDLAVLPSHDMGLTNYYRRFIKDFTQIARLMNILT